LNGREVFVGSDVGALESALRNDARRDHLGIEIFRYSPLRLPPRDWM
jgi:hypothetical protein